MIEPLNKRILIAGIGNIFKGDDGFGVEVVRRLSQRNYPQNIEIMDFGIRGFDLAFTLLDGVHDFVILVDLVQRGGQPGTLYVLDLTQEYSKWIHKSESSIETHGMHPAVVLAWVKALGGQSRPIKLLGCEPDYLCHEDEVMEGLSERLNLAIEPAIQLIDNLLEQIVRE